MPETEELQGSEVPQESSAPAQAESTATETPPPAPEPEVPAKREQRMVPLERLEYVNVQKKKLGEDYAELQRKHAELEARAREYQEQALRRSSPQPQEQPDEIQRLLKDLQGAEGKVDKSTEAILKQLQTYEQNQRRLEQQIAAQQAMAFYDKHIPAAVTGVEGVTEDELRNYIFSLPVNHPHAKDPYAAAEEMASFKDNLGAQYIKSADRTKLSRLLGEMGLTIADVQAAQAQQAPTQSAAPATQGLSAPSRPTGSQPSGNKPAPKMALDTREDRVKAVSDLLKRIRG